MHEVSKFKSKLDWASKNICYKLDDSPLLPYFDAIKKKIDTKILAAALMPLMEIFALINRSLQIHFEIIDQISFQEKPMKEGVYLVRSPKGSKQNILTGLAVVDIPTGSFRSIAMESTGLMNRSKHTKTVFEDIHGSYLIPFSFDENYIHPNYYTYLVINNNIDEVVPFEAYSFDESDNLNAYWVEEAISFLNVNYGFNVKVAPTEDFIQKY